MLIVIGREQGDQARHLTQKLAITDVLTDDRELEFIFFNRPVVHHLDELVQCSQEESGLFDRSQKILAEIVENAKRGLGPLGVRHRGVALGELTKMITSSNLFFALRRIHVADKLLGKVSWDAIYVLAIPGPTADLIQAVMVDVGVTGRDAHGWLLANEPVTEGLSAWPSEGTAIDAAAPPSDVPAAARLRSSWGRLRQELTLRRLVQEAKRYIKGFRLIVPNRTTHRDQMVAAMQRGKFQAPALVVFAAHPEYSRTALPVISGLAPTRHVVAVTEGAFAPPTEDAFRNDRIVFTPLLNHIGKPQLWVLLFSVARIVLKSWLHRGRFFDSVLPANLEYRELIAQQMDQSFWHYAIAHLSDAEKLYQIFRATNPSVLIAVNDQFPAGSIATAFAQRLNVPSVYVQESIFSDNDRAGYIHCQYAAAMDERHRQLLVRLGSIRPDHVRVTGLPPRTEQDLRAKPKLSASETFEKLGLSQDRKVVLFAMQTLSMPYTAEVTKAVAAAVETLSPDVALVIKTHPGHDPRIVDAIQGWIGSRPGRVVVVSDIDISSLIAIASCVVSCFSSTLLEAAVYGKPSIIFNLLDEPHLLPFDREGIAIGAKSTDELRAALRDVLENGPLVRALVASRQAYFRANPQVSDRQSVARACSFIEEIAQHGGLAS